MHFCKRHTLYSFDPFIIIVRVYLGLYSPSLLWQLLPGPLRLSALAGNMAKALTVVTLYPLAMLGTSVCGTNIHRCTAARWGAGRGSVMIGTEVPGRRCHVNEEELLSPSDGSYCLPNSQPCCPVNPLHVDLFEDLTRDCSFQEILGILVGALALQLQGLELSQEVVNLLAGALMKTQELGPCPLLVISWEKEGLDLRL